MPSDANFYTRHLKGFVKFNVKFINVTGLLIQQPIHAQAYKIGGADRYPMTSRKRYDGIGELEVPYVPGSSLKGRMRGLLELAMNLKLYTTDEQIWQHVRSLRAMGLEAFLEDLEKRGVINELMGWAAASLKQLLGELRGRNIKYSEEDVRKIFSNAAVTRLLFSDFFPSKSYIERSGARYISDFLEEKAENRIDRITSAADPRDIVRVKPGVEFEGEITMLLFDNDNNMVRKYLETIATGFELLEHTYIGSSGSRGYGRISFSEISANIYKIDPKDLGSGNKTIVKKLGEIKSSSLEDFKSKLGEIEKSVMKIFEQ